MLVSGLSERSFVRKQFIKQKVRRYLKWRYVFLFSSIYIKLSRLVQASIIVSAAWLVYIVTQRYFRFFTTVLPSLLNYSCFMFHTLATFQFKSLVDIVVVDTSKNFRFRVYYLLINYSQCVSKTILTYISSTTSCYSLTPVFKSAAWAEREFWDLFGIRPIANYEINRILTDYNFEYHPFREDFSAYYLTDIDFTEWDELVDVGRQFKKQWYELGL